MEYALKFSIQNNFAKFLHMNEITELYCLNEVTKE